jgi:hypothetical protein
LLLDNNVPYRDAARAISHTVIIFAPRRFAIQVFLAGVLFGAFLLSVKKIRTNFTG